MRSSLKRGNHHLRPDIMEQSPIAGPSLGDYATIQILMDSQRKTLFPIHSKVSPKQNSTTNLTRPIPNKQHIQKPIKSMTFAKGIDNPARSPGGVHVTAPPKTLHQEL
jgi:hypothetical protein